MYGHSHWIAIGIAYADVVGFPDTDTVIVGLRSKFCRCDNSATPAANDYNNKTTTINKHLPKRNKNKQKINKNKQKQNTTPNRQLTTTPPSPPKKKKKKKRKEKRPTTKSKTRMTASILK